jgi:hypothetical protein
MGLRIGLLQPSDDLPGAGFASGECFTFHAAQNSLIGRMKPDRPSNIVNDKKPGLR